MVLYSWIAVRGCGALGIMTSRHARLLTRAQPQGAGHSANAGAHHHRNIRTGSTAASVGAAVEGGRPSSAGVGLELRLITENAALVRAHLVARGASPEIVQSVDELEGLAAQRSELIQQGDSARTIRKTLSAEIGKLLRDDKASEAEAMKAEVEAVNLDAQVADDTLAKIDAQCAELFSALPNLLHDDTPEGGGEAENVVMKEWGTEDRLIGEEGTYLWHDDIAAALSGYHSETAAQLSGARFSVLSGPVARLERALVQFFLDRMGTNGYTEVSVPCIVSRSTLEGTGQLPKFEDDLFKLTGHQANGEDAFLIPTGEVPLTNMYRDTILSVKDLPVAVTGLTPCFRAEAGSYGKDTRGLTRQHQFNKVEMVQITAPEESDATHEAMTRHAEELLEALELPYRRVRLCSGDLGFSARICHDLEVWLPGQQAYREISSISSCADFQARRLGLRYRPAPPPAPEGAAPGGKKKKVKQPKPVFCHTLNGSGLAVGRALVAVLENYQQSDGSVKVPTVLQPYLGGAEVLVKPKQGVLQIK